MADLAVTGTPSSPNVAAAAESDVKIESDIAVEGARRIAGWPYAWTKLPTRAEYLAMKMEAWNRGIEPTDSASLESADSEASHDQSSSDIGQPKCRVERLWMPPLDSAQLKSIPDKHAYFQSLVEEEMEWHGLTARRWKVAYDRCKSRLGACDYNRRTLSFSRHLIAGGTPRDMRDTILHEIAHALVGRRHAHDTTWRQVALEIGCNGERLYTGECLVRPAWILRCSGGCWSSGRHKRVLSMAQRKCGQCNAPCEFVKNDAARD